MKSTTGYDFDFTCPSEYWHYNPLRDPHLKMYFNRPHMLKRLIRRKYVLFYDIRYSLLGRDIGCNV